MCLLVWKPNPRKKIDPSDLNIWKGIKLHWISPLLIITCVKTNDQGIMAGIIKVDAQKGLDLDTWMISEWYLGVFWYLTNIGLNPSKAPFFYNFYKKNPLGEKYWSKFKFVL
jgi:hypothetical protein